MPRYCKQYSEYDCGPTAVLNALKWAGYSLTLQKGYKALRHRCGWEKGEGTKAEDLVKTLKQYSKIKVKYLNKRVTLKDLDSVIENKQSFILLYIYKDKQGKDEGHFVFGWGKDTRHYLVYNDTRRKPKKRLTRKLMNKYLRRKTRNKEPWSPHLILIKKK